MGPIVYIKKIVVVVYTHAHIIFHISLHFFISLYQFNFALSFILGLAFYWICKFISKPWDKIAVSQLLQYFIVVKIKYWHFVLCQQKTKKEWKEESVWLCTMLLLGLDFSGHRAFYSVCPDNQNLHYWVVEEKEEEERVEKQSKKVALKAQWNKIDDNKTAMQENHCLNSKRVKRKNDIQISLGQIQNVLLLLLFSFLFIFRGLRRWIENERKWDRNWKEEIRDTYFKRRNKLIDFKYCINVFINFMFVYVGSVIDWTKRKDCFLRIRFIFLPPTERQPKKCKIAICQKGASNPN